MSGGNSGVGNNNIITTTNVCDNGTVEAIQYLSVDGLTGNVVSVHYTDADGNAYTPVGPITIGSCPVADPLVTVSYTACDGGINEVDVDSTIGAYLLNQDYTHYQVLYDNFTREIAGDIILGTAGNDIEIDVSGVLGTNVSIQNWYVDFGTGHTEIFNGGTVFYPTAGVIPGKYEAKIFARYDDNGRQINKLMGALEYQVTGGAPFWHTPSPFSASRTWTATDGAFIRAYCGDNVSGIFDDFAPDGTPYVPFGTPLLTQVYVHDELIDHADSSNLKDIPETINAYQASIANGVYAADLGPDGTTWTPPAVQMTSLTIHAKKSDTDYAIPNVARNQVVVETYGSYAVIEDGQTVTFSAEDNNNLSVGDVICYNDAAAQIFYTVRA